MPRSTPPNPMDRLPATCDCGAPAARAEVVTRHCFVCRRIAAEHPDWSPEQVTAAGARRWLELALAGARTVALFFHGQTVSRDADFGRVVDWTVLEGYERLRIRGGEAEPVLALLPALYPDLEVEETAEAGGVVGVKLVARVSAEVG